MHKKNLQGNLSIGPMEAFVSKAYKIQKRLATDSNVSDELNPRSTRKLFFSEIYPFTIIESELFMTLLRLCLICKRYNVFFPKAYALRDGIMKRTEMMKEELKQMMANESTAVHLCLDMWTSSNQFSFLAITAHYIDEDWDLKEK